MRKITYILLILLFVQLENAFSVDKPAVVFNYDCKNADISVITVEDTNNDGIYDLFSIQWCNGTSDSYPIYAIGDIRKWPPRGIPIRNLVYSDEDKKMFLEKYFGSLSKNYVKFWFSKSEDNDTVFFYDNINGVSEVTAVKDISLNSLKFKVYPNPANNFINFEYSIIKSGWVTLRLYNEIGIQLSIIEEKYKYSGVYSSQYQIKRLNSGIYYLVIEYDGDTIISKRFVIVR